MFLIAFVLLAFIIDETLCAPKGKGGGTTVSPLGTRTRNPDKVHGQDSICNLLNYGEFNEPGIQTFTLNDPNEPIKKYQTGHKNRVEYVRAGTIVLYSILNFQALNMGMEIITVQTIQTKGSATNDATRKFAREMGKPTDDAGHIIGNNLGGTGRNVYNIFPQSPNINRGAWSQEEKDIRNLVLTHKQPVEVIVQLYYPTIDATRPNRFTYRATYNGACHTASVDNP
ncbi:unnamed protein product [Adineta steineri]|uniref:Type VII secretion system protein EssD-like domain-containing protein n=1 Tax=Adineta steineri TaxID=433720 RepID=A0A819MX12_9BILA|nr:unnamed protein product [Adineta steineri]CAF3985395.1 unnamed protein product [Adineta steineri]